MSDIVYVDDNDQPVGAGSIENAQIRKRIVRNPGTLTSGSKKIFTDIIKS